MKPFLPHIQVKFEPRDIWIGVYWKYKRSLESPSEWLTLYICILPMLPIILNWHWGWNIKDRAYEVYCQSSWNKGMTAMDYREWKKHK